MIREIESFKREKIFKHYNECDNPFLCITTSIDITNVVEYCSVHKNFYATMGYLITKTVNEIDEFKYRYQNEKFYYCDEIKSNYTQMYEDGNIGYFDLPVIKKYDEYIKKFIEIQEKFLKNCELLTENDLDEIWLSCIPWFSFSSITTPFKKSVTIPQFIWDKYKSIENRYYTNLMIMIHHGFADGSHIAKFLDLLQQNINKFIKE